MRSSRGPRRIAGATLIGLMIAGLFPSSAALAASGAEARHVVVFDESGPKPGFAGTVARLGGRVGWQADEVGLAIVSGLSDAGTAALRAAAGVAFVEADVIVAAEEEAVAEELDGDVGAGIGGAAGTGVTIQAHASPTAAEFYPRQWNMRAIRADEAWNVGRLGSPAVTAFVLDTGIDYLHPDLAGLVDLTRSISLVSSYSTEDALVASLPGNRHPVTDLHSHGTAIAGLIVSNGHHLAGVTQRTTLVGVKVHDRFRMGPVSNYLQGVVYAAKNGADVIHLSIPVEFDKRANPGLVAAVSRAMNYAHARGAVLVAAAGNAVSDLDHDVDRFRFCNAVHVICVSATGPLTADGLNGPWSDVDEIAAYTNFGRSAIDVAGPGGVGAPLQPTTVWLVCSQVSQVTTLPQRPCRPGALDPRRLIWSSIGTSFGAGATSGLAALLVSIVGRGRPSLVEAAITQSAVDLGRPGRDPYYGRGRIDVLAAVSLAGN